MVLRPRIGITGSSGMLGKHVVEFFLKKKYHVIASSRSNPKINKKNFLWKKLDLNEKNFTEKFKLYFKNIECLIHIGAYVPKKNDKIDIKYIYNVNTKATVQLAKWSKKNKIHFIFISGSAIYKKDKKNIESSKILNFSKNVYLNSKIKSEKKITKLSKKSNFKYTVLRPSSIYGAGIDKNKIISKYLKLTKLNKKLIIFDYDKTLVNFIHANDIANAIYLCFILKKKGTFNLGSKTCHNFYDLSRKLKKITKSKSQIDLVKTNKFKQLKSLDVNIDKSIKHLNWFPKIKLEKGLKMIVDNKWI